MSLASEICALIKQNPEITGPQVLEAMNVQHLGEHLNPQSIQVACSNARKKLGINRAGKTKRKPRQSQLLVTAEKAVAVVSRQIDKWAKAKTAADVSSVRVDTESLLHAAKRLCLEAGSFTAAIEAIKTVEFLQINK